jgi:aryl-alcohol dehydrogenase-like predicted oxidoreductase
MLTRRDLVAAAPAALLALTAVRAVAQSSGAAPRGLQYRNLGKSDLRVSTIGLGCNSYGAKPGDTTGRRLLNMEETRAVLNAAFESGVTFFDTADVYGVDGGSETFVGEVFKDRRKQVVIGTKWGAGARSRNEPGWGKRAYIRKSLEDSLRRLQTDYVDLYQLHFYDEATPIGETLTALDELVREGKVRQIGVSNVSAAQLENMMETARKLNVRTPVSVQNQYSLLETDAEKDVLPACAKHGISFIPYYPLASGLLTGKYRRNQPAPEGARLANRPISDDDYASIEALEKFAKQRGRTLLDLAFAGLTAHPQIASVIAGATKPEQIRQNAASAGWVLTSTDVGELRKLTADL